MRQIREWLDLPVIEIDHTQCLNCKSPSVICEKCVQACPTKALKLADKAILLKESECIDCTACVSACPVLAVEYMPSPYTKTINEITAYPDADITCKQFEKYQKGIKIPCYLSIDEAMLTHYYTTQVLHSKKTGKSQANLSLELFLGKCISCTHKDDFDIDNHIKTLTSWCKELEIPLTIKASYDPQTFLEKQTVAVSGITRRSLFKSLGLRGNSENDEKNKDIKKESKMIEEEELSYKQKNHYKQKMIAKGLKLAKEFKTRKNTPEHAAEDIASKPSMPKNHFALVKKSEACRKCNICTRICPTNALEWIESDATATLNFYPVKCIACRRCGFCPERSISIVPISSDCYYNQEIIQLAELPMTVCEDCGEIFKTDIEAPKQSICQQCIMKEEKKRALFDSL